MDEKGRAEALVDLGEASGTKQGADHIPRTSWCINTSTFLHFTLIPLSHPKSLMCQIINQIMKVQAAPIPTTNQETSLLETKTTGFHLIQQFELNLPIFPKYVSFFHLDSDAHS